MNTNNQDFHDIEKLFQTTFEDEIQPETEQQLRNRFVEFQKRCEQSAPERIPWFRFPKTIAWSSGIVATAACILIISFTLMQPPGAKVYAAAMEALRSVQTIHIQGWSDSLTAFINVYSPEIADASKPFQIEAWEWINADGEYRSYKQGGPFYIREDGDRRYEYNRDTDVLQIKKTEVELLNKVPEAAVRLMDFLKKYNIQPATIENRMINNHLCRGMSVEKGTRWKIYWFDVETNLPIEISMFKEDGDIRKHYAFMQFFYNEPIPQDILVYSGPENPKQTLYDWAIDPRFEKWHQHLRKLAYRYQAARLPEVMELIPRANDEEFQAYYNGRMPGIDGYSVCPLHITLGDYLRTSHVYNNGTIRVPEELEPIQFNHDMIVIHRTPFEDQMRFLLDSVNLEIVESQEERSVWIAKYDGRPLKPWKEVKAPVSSEGARHTKPGMASGFSPACVTDLFNQFNYWQDYDLTAQGIFIVDETGLPQLPDINANREPIAISSETPYWGGEESSAIARKWFEKEFGITFTEEKRVVTVHTVRNKEEKQQVNR